MVLKLYVHMDFSDATPLVSRKFAFVLLLQHTHSNSNISFTHLLLHLGITHILFSIVPIFLSRHRWRESRRIRDKRNVKPVRSRRFCKRCSILLFQVKVQQRISLPLRRHVRRKRQKAICFCRNWWKRNEHP